jgi:hypothetical protein
MIRYSDLKPIQTFYQNLTTGICLPYTKNRASNICASVSKNNQYFIIQVICYFSIIKLICWLKSCHGSGSMDEEDS